MCARDIISFDEWRFRATVTHRQRHTDIFAFSIPQTSQFFFLFCLLFIEWTTAAAAGVCICIQGQKLYWTREINWKIKMKWNGNMDMLCSRCDFEYISKWSIEEIIKLADIVLHFIITQSWTNYTRTLYHTHTHSKQINSTPKMTGNYRAVNGVIYYINSHHNK